jgi:hypothetical protein
LIYTTTTLINLPKSFAQTTNTITAATRLNPPQQQQCATTEPTIQGQEYKAGPPFRQGQDFAKGLQGPRLQLTGRRVLSPMECKPVQGAILDIWQADSSPSEAPPLSPSSITVAATSRSADAPGTVGLRQFEEKFSIPLP